ncbi:hypothetical protein [Zavarzinia compransoris]|uniref:DUF4136 domain-containing protein n=1 Tax=Zavarzinia compransoris TaxID=1264899 RepID=A0A317EAZ3_9PROT|nr:hypothetical protein [Zavarzinia compransoris]PWR24119.1 hypothetical protein DKG75_05040 [Zavarzinia compransoris]TDP48163.1 hypothetical protein DES42_102465 [Zavarzinia compransoris]
MNLRASAFLLALAAAGGLAGCASPRADAALEAQNNLVGMSKATLLSCAGAPAAAMAASPTEEVLTYESRSVRGYRSGPSFGLGIFGGSGHVGYGMGFPIFGGADYVDDSENCRASFTLRNGVVTKVVYGGTDQRTAQRLEQCYQILENCLQRPAVASPAG